MQIRVGYELIHDCPQPTPMILTLNVHWCLLCFDLDAMAAAFRLGCLTVPTRDLGGDHQQGERGRPEQR